MTTKEFTQRFIEVFAPYNEEPFEEYQSCADACQWISELYEDAKEALTSDD